MRTSMVLVLLAVVVGGIACNSSTSGLQTQYEATLNGNYVVPDTVTQAGGTASFTLNVNGTTVNGVLTVTNDPTNPLDSFTVGHIHSGIAGSFGGIVLNLCGTTGLPACRGTINWTYTSPTSSTAMPGTANDEAYSTFISSLGAVSTGAYVQLHSTRDGGGEIRGQILRVDQGY